MSVKGYDTYAKEASLLYHEKYDGGRLPMKTGVVELLTFLKEKKKRLLLLLPQEGRR